MLGEPDEWVVLGMTTRGDVFDVPEWHERLCGMFASPTDTRLTYSDYLTPGFIDGLPAVIVLRKLKDEAPQTYELVKNFVDEHQLKTRTGRTVSIESTGMHPVLQQERRTYFRG